MASDDPSEKKIRDLMWVERPAETHLSQSSTPGGSSSLARDDDNALVTHAVLFPAEDIIKLVAATAATAAAVGIVVGAAAVKAAPRVKNRFNDLKSKLNRKSQDTVQEAATANERTGQPSRRYRFR
ncbi:hypothetical protein [Streptomyces sp. NBC_01643]|uniref:hypothetical protein n=1 Tax=Streptomyces sp. NBC_01643 TaxID=2975906 RepID=UPI002F90C7FD|nr:hypothetical protein OHB03_48660 [Streptomyces sp. NBC_01643]